MKYFELVAFVMEAFVGGVFTAKCRLILGRFLFFPILNYCRWLVDG